MLDCASRSMASGYVGAILGWTIPEARMFLRGPDRARHPARVRLLARLAAPRPRDVGQPRDDAPRPPLRPQRGARRPPHHPRRRRADGRLGLRCNQVVDLG